MRSACSGALTSANLPQLASLLVISVLRTALPEGTSTHNVFAESSNSGAVGPGDAGDCLDVFGIVSVCCPASECTDTNTMNTSSEYLRIMPEDPFADPLKVVLNVSDSFYRTQEVHLEWSALAQVHS